MNDGPMSGYAAYADRRDDERARWQALPRGTRFSVWTHYATVVAYPVAAVVATVAAAGAAAGWWWMMTGWWWPALAATILLSMFLWQVVVLWLLRQVEPDSVRRRMTFSAVNSTGSVAFDVAALFVALMLWRDDGPGAPVRGAGIAAIVIAVMLALDVYALWNWRRWLPPLSKSAKTP